MPSFKYPRQARIRKRRDFLACYERGIKFHSEHFVLFALADGSAPSRSGMAVTRKVGNAVARNRMKRVLREFFRLNLQKFPGWQIVVAAKKNAAGLGFSETEAELGPLLTKLAKGSWQRA